MREEKRENLYDVVIVGGGPAGLTAALYLARARYRVLVVEKERFGGQIAISSEVVNYPGVLSADGGELTETMRRQAGSFGAEFLMAEVESLSLEGEIKTVRTSRGDLDCFGVLLATGAQPRSVGFQGEEEFRGRGVAYCATCDGEFFTGKEVFVIGGGYAAAEESVFLTRYASHVTILMRGEDFSCAKSLADAARSNEKISVVANVQVESVTGGDRGVTAIRCRDRKTGQLSEHRASGGESIGVFVFAGYVPATALVKGIVELNEQGYVITDQQQKTSVEGLYAAGDVCVKNLRQVVTAVGDGATAATELEKYAAAMQKKTGLIPARPVSSAETAEADGEKTGRKNDGPFPEEVQVQLKSIFARMERPLILRLYLDERPVSHELERYIRGLAELTDKLTVERAPAVGQEGERPCVRILRADRTETGLAFHGVPGGHEFTSFVLGLYNASGPGQTLEPEVEKAIRDIASPVKLQVLVSLSCSLCPDMVTAAQRIAAENEQVTAEVYDVNQFPALKEQYRVMSVPCLVMDGEQVSFGKKSIRQLLSLIADAKKQ